MGMHTPDSNVPRRRTARTARLCIGVIAAVLLAATSAEAMAAEGCYLRVGLGFERPTETEFRDRDCEIESPVPLYGCGPAPDGGHHRSVGDFGTVSALEVGIGGTVAPAVRMEALIECRPNHTFNGRANFLAPERRQSVSAELSALSAMVAAYADLPALGLPRLGPFDPFFGAGVGVARIRTGETQMMFPKTTTHVPSGHRTGLAWMVTAGLTTALGENTMLDVAWRYSDLGTAESATGGGRVVWHDGSREPLLLDQAASEARLRSHGLRFSLRHVF